MLKPSILVLLALGTTSCSLGPKYSVYGADLETRAGARAVLWAKTDDYSEFRYIVERQGEGADRVQVLRRRAGVEPFLGVGPIAGVAVMLPPSVTQAQRDAANQLLGEIGAYQPSMSTHLVVTGVEWSDVKSVDAMIERSREARDIMLPEGRAEFSFPELLRAFSPNLTVIPIANSDGTNSGRFLAASAMRPIGVLTTHDAKEYEYFTASTADLVMRMAAASLVDPVLSSGSMKIEGKPLRTAVVLIPSDASPACRAACNDLLGHLLEEADDSWMIVRRVTGGVSAEEITEADVLAEAMPELFHSALRPGH